MKIAMADNCGLKFSQGIKEWWEKKGHEVKYERGASPYLAQWADLYYVDWWDNNIHYLYDLYHDDPRQQRYEGWDNNRKPIFVCRAIDWEIWIGFVRSQPMIDWIDKVICLAPHMETKLMAEADFGGKLKLIKPGLDLSKWPLKKKKTDGFQIGMVLGDMWVYKNNIGGLNIFALLPDDQPWKLHIRGQHEAGEFNPIYYNHFIETRGLTEKITLYPHINDMNEFYENIDFLLVPCLKEAFNYGIAEAMAKGIRPVINNFYGSEAIWPKEYIFNNYWEAVDMMMYGKPRPPEEYRKFIEDNYSIERMMNAYDQFLGT